MAEIILKVGKEELLSFPYVPVKLGGYSVRVEYVRVCQDAGTLVKLSDY